MNNFKSFLEEATIKQELERNPRLLDPALLTYEEYYKIANERGKYHPSDAYDWSVADLNNQVYLHQEDFNRLINTITVKGIRFEVRAKVMDNLANKYVKYDPVTDEQVRINGEIQYYTRDELISMGKPHYAYEFAIIEKETNQFVAVSQDEWGAILIVVAREYRGFGLGLIISKLTRQYMPGKTSGGFTSAGHSTFIKAHRDFVRDYLRTGKYNELIKAGSITPERVKEIIASARLDLTKPKSKIKFDLEPGEFNIDPSKWMLFTENSDFVIYDSRLKDYWETDLDSYWLDRFFIGMIYATEGLSGDKIARIHSFGGFNDDVKRYLLLLQLTQCKHYDEKLLMDQEQVKLVEGRDGIKIENSRERGMSLVTLTGKGIDYSGLTRREQTFRKSFDKYGEFGIYVGETAYKNFQ